MHRPLAIVTTLAVAAAAPASVLANDTSRCWRTTPGSSNPPDGRVEVEIEFVEPNSDLEGAEIPGFDNRADIYGVVTIDGIEHDLPKMDETNHPSWVESGTGTFVNDMASASQLVPISIVIRESDVGPDDTVDINPMAGKSHLDLVFDTCSQTITGDLGNISAGGFLTSSGGSESNDALIQFRVRMADNRPTTVNDLAMVELDVVQVVPASERLVAEKPTVVVALIANNHDVDVSTSVRVRIAAVGSPPGGFGARDDTFPITVAAGAVERFTFYEAAPLQFPAGNEYQIAVEATVDPGGDLPDDPSPDECAQLNNGANRLFHWRVLTIQAKPMLWMKTGLLSDAITGLETSDIFDTITSYGNAYINATYPVSRLQAEGAPIPATPPINAASEWIVSILSNFGFEWVECVQPYALTFELDAVAVLLGYDRLLGVVPQGWFADFPCTAWSGVKGLSLVDWMPHAVIFEARAFANEDNPGLYISNPAHELGHTFAISTDSSIKGFWCSIDLDFLPTEMFDLSNLPCGIDGGFDERNIDDPIRAKGNPAMGYWLPQDDEPPELSALVNGEICDSHCFMDSPLPDRHEIWGSNHIWIDHADYRKLFDEYEEGVSILFSAPPDDEILYVSGMIGIDDSVYLGNFYRLQSGEPDAVDTLDNALYGVALVDRDDNVLREVGIHLNLGVGDINDVAPFTAFGLRIPFPAGTRKIQIWNRLRGTKLAERDVSLFAPIVNLQRRPRGEVVRAGTPLQLRWVAFDADGDALTHTVAISDDGENWWPGAAGVTRNSARIPTDDLVPGTYFAKVIAADGVNTAESQPKAFIVTDQPPGNATRPRGALLPATARELANVMGHGLNAGDVACIYPLQEQAPDAFAVNAVPNGQGCPELVPRNAPTQGVPCNLNGVSDEVCIDFEQSDQSFIAANNSSFDVPDDGQISFLVVWRATRAVDTLESFDLMHKIEPAFPFLGWALIVAPAGISFNIGTDGATGQDRRAVSTAHRYDDGAPHVFAAVYDRSLSNTMSLITEREIVSTSLAGLTGAISSDPFTIGQKVLTPPGDGFDHISNGQMAYLAVFDTALTDEQVKAFAALLQ